MEGTITGGSGIMVEPLTGKCLHIEWSGWRFRVCEVCTAAWKQSIPEINFLFECVQWPRLRVYMSWGGGGGSKGGLGLVVALRGSECTLYCVHLLLDEFLVVPGCTVWLCWAIH